MGTPLPLKIEVSADAQERARVAWFETDQPVGQIASALGMAETTLYRRAVRWGWPARRVVRKRPGHDDPRLSGRAAGTPGGTDLRARLEALLAGSIAALESGKPAGRDADPERTARALAMNVRTLATLQRVAAGQDDDAPTDDESEAPPRSLSALRDELREHLRRLRKEGRSRRGVRAAESDSG